MPQRYRWHRAMAWWLALALAAILPMWSFWLVNRWGGHYTGWVYYGSHRDALSACFVVSAALVAGLLHKPKRHAGLRGTAGLIFVTLCVLAAGGFVRPRMRFCASGAALCAHSPVFSPWSRS